MLKAGVYGQPEYQRPDDGENDEIKDADRVDTKRGCFKEGLEDLGKPDLDRIPEVVGGFGHFEFYPVGKAGEDARVGFAGKQLPFVEAAATIGADIHLPFGTLLDDSLFLLQEGGDGLIAIGNEGIRSVYGGLHDAVDEADDGGVDHEDDADSEGTEERVKVDGFGTAEVAPYPVGDEPEGAETADGLAHADELTAFAEHGLKDGV